MKMASIIVLSFILLVVVILFLGAIALSAARRARLRGQEQGRMDYSDAETVRFTRELLERQARGESEDDK